jgi:glycerol uptake facilitator-like aquaporin
MLRSFQGVGAVWGGILLRVLRWNQSQSIECDPQDHYGKDDPSDIPPPSPASVAWFASEFAFEKILVVEILLLLSI